MRIIAPVGRGPVFVQTGCILTPVMLLVYLVYWALVLEFLLIAWIGIGMFYAGKFAYYGGRHLYRYARRMWLEDKASAQAPPDEPENPAKYSDRR